MRRSEIPGTSANKTDQRVSYLNYLASCTLHANQKIRRGIPEPVPQSSRFRTDECDRTAHSCAPRDASYTIRMQLE
ncbi:hypothetical protein A0H81_05873 [Grifola frondosa]|uniref:Uncharacterized protein n=1 Tax=Grifola frondosa TaxID=5627 RepID=A0A1C7MCD1_GRIFR|nr:hypothetical protein A0H81_05873 [Grifola frondosa]